MGWKLEKSLKIPILKLQIFHKTAIWNYRQRKILIVQISDKSLSPFSCCMLIFSFSALRIVASDHQNQHHLRQHFGLQHCYCADYLMEYLVDQCLELLVQTTLVGHQDFLDLKIKKQKIIMKVNNKIKLFLFNFLIQKYDAIGE